MQMKTDDGSLLRRKALVGRAQSREIRLLARPRIARLDPPDIRLRREYPFQPGSASLPNADCLANYDSIEPRTQARFVTQGRSPPPSLLQSDLHRVGCVRHVAANQARKAEQPIVMFSDEHFECCVGKALKFNHCRGGHVRWLGVQVMTV